MEEISYLNHLIIESNKLKMDFERCIRNINDSNLFNIKIANPIDLVQDAIYKLKKQGEDSNFDIFGEESYLKFIYVSYFEATIAEMTDCMHNMVSYLNSKPISRIAHRRLVNQSFEVFNKDYFLLKIFEPNFAIDYYRMMLQNKGYFDSFKPGMFYKYSVFILNELQEFGLELEKDESFIFIMNYVRLLEEEMSSNKQSVDYDSYDNELEKMSKKYHVDFISLDKDYTVETRGLTDEEKFGDSSEGKRI